MEKLKGLFLYYLSNYLRSYKSILPIFLYIFAVAVNYGYTPNPILDSYSLTSLVLFFVMGWIVVTVFHAEDFGQRQITLLHAKNKRKYYLTLILVCMLMGCLLSIFAVAYPIIMNSFGVKVHLVHIIMGFLSHFILSVLAISLSAIFTREVVKNRANTWWGVLSILIFSVVIVSVKEKILYVSGLIWLLPPVHLSLEIMGADDGIKTIPLIYFLQFGWIVVYSIFLVGLFLILVRYRRLDQ